MTGRERCDRLKAIRASLAARLGVDLHQVECTFEGECRGTCPKCRQEEDALNAALLHKGAAVAGATLLATSLAACVPGTGIDLNPFDGGGTVTQGGGGDDLSGYVACPDDGDDDADGIEVLTGEVDERTLRDEGDDALTGKVAEPQPDDDELGVPGGTGAEPIEIEDLTGYVG